MPEDLGERSEAPTSKRLSDAREKGQLAKSTALSSALLLLSAVGVLILLSGPVINSIGQTVRSELEQGLTDLASDDASVISALVALFGRIGLIMAPTLPILALAAYLSHFVQIGWLLTTKPLEPQLSRLNVLKGIAKLFSKRSLARAVINVLKVSIIASVASIITKDALPLIAALPLLDPSQAVVSISALLVKLALWLLLVLLFLGVIDLLYQRWQHTEDLKMTRQEVKDERKSTEGDPEVKARRLRIARQIALQRLRSDVPKADVIVTNPTHFAVALKYDAKSMRAPKVIAKGADFLALQIRNIAASHGVPIVERPPLARALYYNVEIGREVPHEQYEAVAEVLAYVYRLEGRKAV
mgnify:CR=1 FL=1